MTSIGLMKGPNKGGLRLSHRQFTVVSSNIGESNFQQASLKMAVTTGGGKIDVGENSLDH